MKVINVSKNITLAEDAAVARTMLQNTEGLLNATAPRAMLLRTRWGIHTFEMRFPIDVVITDATSIVRKIRRGLPPNRFFFWNPKYRRVLELPEGAIEKSGTEVGDMLAFPEEQ